MSKGNYTVLYEKDGVTYKLCKILFGSDGSYYVTSPYHPAEKAVLLKMTVNYALQETVIPIEQAVDIASAEDDDKRIKLSHHPDGFIQFSGQGILSGKDAEGNIRGIGVMSWPLDHPVRGPAFALSMRGVEKFQQANKVRGEVCLFKHEELTPMPNANVLTMEGYYFPPLWRRFIETSQDGTKTISIVHPAGAVLRLKVIFAPEQCARPGFIGLEMYTDFDDSEDMIDSFILSGSTGNLRENEQGQLLADGIYCMYPRSNIQVRRSVDYILDSIPPQP